MLHEKNINKLAATILLSISSFAVAEEIFIHKPFVFSPSSLGEITVSHDDSNFYVWSNDQRYQVNYYDLDPILRNPCKEKLQKFFKQHYIAVSQCDNGDFIIKSRVRTRGGGPILASAFYWGTKAVCYGTAGAAIGAGVATGVPMVAGAATTALAAAGVPAAAGSAAATAATTVAATTATAGASAVVTPGSIAVTAAIGTSAAATETAAFVTASTVATSGGVAGAVATVEAASAGMGAIGMMIPFL